MLKAKIHFLFVFSLVAFLASACDPGTSNNQSVTTNTNSSNASSTNSKGASNKSNSISTDEDSPTSGIEKVKPTAGKGNVQGKVFFNSKPAEGIEVNLCEEFSTIMGLKCEGNKLTAKTDKDGTYVLADLEPKQYEGLMAKVFNSDYYVYPQSGFMEAQKFDVAADKTIFAKDIHLFKDDLKITNPKAGGKVDAKGLELKWEPYADAAYYKVYLFAEDTSVLSPVSGERVEAAAFTVDKPLPNGKYRIKVEAYNGENRKLAESGDDIKFTVAGGA